MKIHNSIIYLKISLLLIVVSCISCEREFSKYKQVGDNDLASVNLKGKVKVVKRYWNGQLTDIDKYNKYGFITEEIDYNDGKISEYKKYKYNEYGKLFEVECKDEDRLYLRRYFYDDYNNIIEEIETTKEIYNNQNDYEIGDRLLWTYKYTYDKLGGIIKSQLISRLGICKGVNYYNNNGKIKRIESYNDEGDLFSVQEYEYGGNLIEKHYNIDQNGNPFLWSEIIKNQDGSKILKEINYCTNEVSDFEYTIEGEKKITKWVASMDAPTLGSNDKLPEYRAGDICTTICEYKRDKQGNVIKETTITYYPKDKFNVYKEPEIHYEAMYKYDSHGNPIYYKIKSEDNQEYTFEIKYY